MRTVIIGAVHNSLSEVWTRCVCAVAAVGVVNGANEHRLGTVSLDYHMVESKDEQTSNRDTATQTGHEYG